MKDTRKKKSSLPMRIYVKREMDIEEPNLIADTHLAAMDDGDTVGIYVLSDTLTLRVTRELLK